MKTFLNLVATDLLQRFGTDLSRVAMVFPGKRAGIFLNGELARIAARRRSDGKAEPSPVWLPQYTDMPRLFGELSDCVAADPIDSITTLYGIYHEILTSQGEEPQSIDKFWSWGEIILSDFDDVDKHLAKAEAVFANVYDLHCLDDLGYLTQEQHDTLAHFFGNFSPAGNSVVKERFLRLWHNMYAIYSRLRDVQKKSRAMYEGAMFREVAEALRQDPSIASRITDRYDAVVFAGFNVLNEVERVLMQSVQKTGKALFYWDYDQYYVGNPRHEAGTFMRANLRDFPCALSREHFDNLSRLRDVTFVSCTSDNAAARYTPAWLSGQEAASDRLGIILCNESLMQPVLHTIPKEAGEVNVTMGFPLADTPIFSFTMSLVTLQTDGYDARHAQFRNSFVRMVESHALARYADKELWLKYSATDNKSLLQYLSDIVRQVASSLARDDRQDIYIQLYLEALFQTSRIINKFVQRTNDPVTPLDVSTITLRRLIREVLSRTSIPFHGEPARGLQVMGVLETRCLDFRNMLLLSVEEDRLPRNTRPETMIPANIREAFGLTTPRHRICVFSYYFYRLIQRTEHLTCVYNVNCSGNEKHEMSRFLRQFLAETDIPVRRLCLEAPSGISGTPGFNVESNADIVGTLLGRYDLSTPGGQRLALSPTAINTYLECPFKFYLSNIAGLRKEQNPEDGIDARLFGNVFHDTAYLIYEKMCHDSGSRILKASTIEKYLNAPERYIVPILDIAFDANLFHPADKWRRTDEALSMLLGGKRPQVSYEGELIIFRNALLTFLKRLLAYDASIAPIEMIGGETEKYLTLNLAGGIAVKVGGRVDRIDMVGGKYRIVDYKTGHHKPTVRNIGQVIPALPGDSHDGYYMQAFLYSCALSAELPDHASVMPVLFYPSLAAGKDYSPSLYIGNEEVTDIRQWKDVYLAELKRKMELLFNPEATFSQTKDVTLCPFCDFRELCGK